MRIVRARTRATAVAAVAVVVVVTACSADPGSPDPGATTAADAASPAPSRQPALTGGDAAYAVQAPGPRRGPLTYADMLIQSTGALSDEVAGAISELAGVESSARITLAQVPIENKIYTIAAVDPAQYRSFTVQDSADFQVQWDRVAGGEIAVDDDLRGTLPVDRNDYLDLTIDETSRQVHVGAWAPQVDGIDMVVNTEVGKALGMTDGNAMVVYTGPVSPQSLRRPINQLLDAAGASVQNLDAVTRFGLDPGTVQNVVLTGSFADAVGVFTYTPTSGGRIAPDPAWVSSHITTEAVPILGSVTCNKFLMPQLKAALLEIQGAGLADEIYPDEYAGCYYPRFIAGSTTLSNHSFGLALDLNTRGNGRGTVGDIDRGVVAIFKRWGFGWGGDWHDTDPRHFELSRLVRPG